jgi:hypothetical protein
MIATKPEDMVEDLARLVDRLEHDALEVQNTRYIITDIREMRRELLMLERACVHAAHPEGSDAC